MATEIIGYLTRIKIAYIDLRYGCAWRGGETMKYYSNIELTKNTYTRLKNTEISGQIHSVFKHTINILNHDGSLFTLVDGSLNNGPNCLKVEGINFEQLNLQKASEVCFKDSKITIKNKLMIDYKNYVFHQQSELSYPENIDHMTKKIDHIKQSKWYLELKNNYQKQTFMKSVDDLIEANATLLFTYIKNKDSVTLQRRTLEKFIGLGIGLTPSGDDFLTGFAYIASLKNYPNTQIPSILGSLKFTMKDQTNLISFQQFEMALIQEVRTEVNICLKNILSNKPFELVEASIKSILDIGSTSGFDMLKGMLFGLEISL